MQLLIDVGNTSIKWTTASRGCLQSLHSFIYTKQNLSSQLNNQLTLPIAETPNTILISNVAGQTIANELSLWCEDTFGLRPVYASVTKQSCGLVNAYTPFNQLGIDRWLALIAATNCFKKPLCVADCGTAVTIDAVDEHGKFIGGIILPGLSMMRQALFANTDAIDMTDVKTIEGTFAKNTQQGVLAGALTAVSASIEYMTNTLQQQTAKPITCVITGGDAEMVRDALSMPVNIVSDLVLQGLYLWGKENELDR